MKKIIIFILIILLAVGAVFFFGHSGSKEGSIVKNDSFEECAGRLISTKSEYMQGENLNLLVGGKSLASFDYDIKMDHSMKVSSTTNFLEDIMGCSVNELKDGSVEIDRNTVALKIDADEIISENGKSYIPISENAEKLGYDIKYSFSEGSVDFINTDDNNNLPEAYDMREHGRVSPVRDQDEWGTCWAFASLGALETISLPKEEYIYSVDHMSRNNGYSLKISEGGEHSMSIAYMAAWRGPVFEKDDPYGDEVTNNNLEAEKHLEEAIIINSRDDRKIKSAIYKYGGVETSIYLAMSYGETESSYYNDSTSSYYYSGTAQPNHAVVVVGWDDHYPKENFNLAPKEDGAYICKNSWGEKFGDKGYFYISYEDVNICNQSIVYTRIGDKDNYDNIYQSDILGWVGQMGYSEEQAYFANVYTSKGDEILKAISFYATGDNTKFKVFVVTDYEDMASLNSGRIEVGQGETRYAGYYTVNLRRDIKLKAGQKYAVIVSVNTPGSERPIAIECDAGERTKDLNLKDGEGYMSLYGEVWHSAEESDANICLKAFTDDDK